MKYWLSHLPLEVWVDVYRYPWISREELGRIVDRFRNRKFAEYLQFFLHDWGKQKLNAVLFDENGLCKIIDQEPFRLYMDFPLVPMPDNIKFFERITINHFDARTIDSLQQIRPVLSDVKLYLNEIPYENLDNLHIIVPNLLPLLNSIHSLFFSVYALPVVQQCFGNEKLAQIKVLETSAGGGMELATVQALVNFLANWLISPRQDNIGPKYCEAVLANANTNIFVKGINLAISQEFLAARTPCTFALVLRLVCFHWQQGEFDEFHLQNGIGEELHGVKIQGPVVTDVHITRHRANCGTELQAWIEEYKSMRSRPNRIVIKSTTIGLLDAMKDAPKPKDGGEDPQQKPSTSKRV